MFSLLSYCRFCAEAKISHKLINLTEDIPMRQEIIAKLSFLNAIYVQLEDNKLPQTVCLVCLESLNKSHEFLYKVRNSQITLTNFFTKEESDDDRGNFEDTPSDNEYLSKKFVPEEEPVTIIKDEPKEEILNTEIENENINVNDILNATIGTVHNIEIYAKELTVKKQKDVKHWRNYTWACSECGIEFLDVDMLRSHAKVVHQRCSTFSCVDCKAFKNGDFEKFISHARKHHKCLRNHCEYCDISVDQKKLPSHLKQKHFDKNQLPCRMCGEIFKSEESLRQHMNEFSPVGKQKRKPRRKAGVPITLEELTCNICQKVYKNPNSLRDHKKLHKTDRKRDYTCERCGKTFYNKGTLTSHIMSHDKVRPHICRICNKTFLFPNMLRRHVEMHTGVKPFSCDQCGRCFRLNYQLNAHKIVHTDSMPHVCQYCNKAFRFKQILKNHERLHTGSKPYLCQNCGMEFTNWSNYNKHMKRRHGLDTAKKKITPEGVFPVNPETGQIIRIPDTAMTEEWKSKVMVPGKRGRKRIIKQEDL